MSNNADAVFAATKKTKFNVDDFMIKNFGIDKDGFPFINVKGTPGGTIPQKENTGYASIFVTNNGTLQYHQIGCTHSGILTK